MIDPQPALARVGTPISDAAGALFYRVYLSRNPVIAERGVTPPAFHPAALALLAITAALLWRLARMARI